MPVKRQPIALTLAGVDSSGGAGVAVDLSTFNALGVRGKCVVTAVTAQSSKAVWGVQGTRPAIITAQLEAAFSECPPQVAKCGMLYSGGVVEAIAEFWGRHRTPLVVDPVLATSSGKSLLNPAGMRALKRRLLPLANVVTPNVPEAEALAGMFIKSPEDMRQAARAIYEMYGCAAVITGGHLRGKEIFEVMYDGFDEYQCITPRLGGGPWRGTGCRFASAVTSELAKNNSLPSAVRKATKWVSAELAKLKGGSRSTR